MRIASLLVGLALMAQAACTRPTPGYCADDVGRANDSKCGPGMVCNRITLLCDRPGSGTVVDGGKDATASDAGDAGTDAGVDAMRFVTCDGPGDCTNGTCVDGVCCQSPSCGQCQSCAVPGSEGRCTSLPRLIDDLDSCMGDRTCDGFGDCLLKQGRSCAQPSQCLSQFCTDGVCCERACTEACFSCNQGSGLGTCLPIHGAEDPVATTPCSGTSTCVAPPGTVPACKLYDGQACAAGPDCLNGTCSTFYRDQDMDSYGVSTPSQWCGQVPPTGYAAMSGDCCDTDVNTRPNQVAPSSARNSCGSFDRNCDSREQKTSGSVLDACGDCMVVNTNLVCITCI